MKALPSKFIFLLMIASLSFHSYGQFTDEGFITTWKTDYEGNTSSDDDVNFPVIGTDFNVYWEEVDNPSSNGSLSDQSDAFTITFPSPGTYRIQLTGDFSQIEMLDSDNPLKLFTVEQWGSTVWESMAETFYGCQNLTITATDSPDLSQVTDMTYCFYFAKSLSGDLSNWDVSNITTMQGTFAQSGFNGDISAWDVSSVADMRFMFTSSSFNQDIGSWDVSAVTDMASMFNETLFNQPIGDWDVGNVENFSGMFSNNSFNHDIGSWDVSSAVYMSSMFNFNQSFDQPIGDWNTSNVTDMGNMFRASLVFNQYIGDWDVSQVTYMVRMFENAWSFNQDIGSWDVGSVTDMSFMFNTSFSNGELNSTFNQDISAWDVSQVINMSYMFHGAHLFDQPLDSWDVSSVTNMSWMFYATVFDQSLDDWDVSSVSDFSHMFRSCQFNQPLGSWNTTGATNMNAMFSSNAVFNQDITDWDVSGVTIIDVMFFRAISFDQSLGSWDLGSVESISYMLGNANLSVSNYESTLAGWAEQADLPTGLTLGVTGLRFCDESSRNILIDDKSWTIEGDSKSGPILEDPLNTITGECTSGMPEAPVAVGCDSENYTGTTDTVFPIATIGNYTITWSFQDSDGNTSEYEQSIIISDNTPPQVDELSSYEASCSVSAVELGTPTAEDSCDGQVQGVTDTSFPITTLGTTVVTWTFTDESDNSTTQTQDVIVLDDESPVPSLEELPALYTDCNGDVAQPDFPTANDNCSGVIIATTNQVFPFAPTESTQIVWEYDDGNGNTEIQFQNVLIIEPDQVTVDESLCEGADFVFPDGLVWTDETSHVSTLTNQQGCDSLVTTNITTLALPEVDLGEEIVFGCVGEDLTFSIDESTVSFETYTISTFFGNSSTDGPLTFTFDQTFAATASTQDVFVTIELIDFNGCVGTDQVLLKDNTMINWGIGAIENNDPDIFISSTILPETADSWTWDFGDGATNDIDVNPSHTYTENGDYTIILTVSNECGDESLATNVSIIGIEEEIPLGLNDSDQLVLYPNPTTQFLNFNYHKPVTIVIHSMNGRLVYQSRLEIGENVDLSRLLAGSYLLQIYDDGHVLRTEKVIKSNF